MVPGARRIPVPANLATGEAWALPIRLRYAPGDAYDLHCHDFPELFWLEEGEAVHRINGEEQELSTGDLLVLRPDDTHALATRNQASEAGFTLVNIPLRPELVADLAQRHRAHVRVWPWDLDLPPFRARLSPGQLTRLREWADELGADSSRLAVEAFLLDLLRMLCAPVRHRHKAALPPWLDDALRVFAEEGRLGGGCAAFIALTGRSADHVNRTVRQLLGCTSTELVNDLRLTRAGRLLRMGEMPILDIALDCGFASLAHFYRAFARKYRTTPKRYRRDHQVLARSGMW
jgi:AraC family cel operon transcriptional repressor